MAAPKAVGGIGFGRGRQIDDGLRQRQLALGRPQEIERILGCERLHDRLRIGEADVLDRHAHQAAGDVERSSPPSSMRASQ